MSKFKFAILNYRSERAFTLIELMVVLVIMTLLGTAVLVNISGQRVNRNLVIAENELVTNIRTAQSYTLSSRTLPSGQNVQYYILKFDLSKPTQYTLQALYNVSSSPQLVDIQTFNFPAGIKLASVSPLVISQRPALPNSQDILAISGATGCGLIVFSAPYGKALFNSVCNPTAPHPSPYSVISTDDYQKILNFVSDVTNATVSSNDVMVITISDSDNKITKQVTINGVIGAVSFN